MLSKMRNKEQSSAVDASWVCDDDDDDDGGGLWAGSGWLVMMGG